MNDYQTAKHDGDHDLMAGIREVVDDLDRELRETGLRGPLAALEPKDSKRRARSTRRRQDAPGLPRKKVARNTIGHAYPGGHRPGMVIILTMPSYGSINRDGATDSDGKTCSDGSPRRPEDYDYLQAARDIIHGAGLFDRWIQNMRRAVGYDVQYFATVKPQKRGAPHGMCCCAPTSRVSWSRWSPPPPTARCGGRTSTPRTRSTATGTCRSGTTKPTFVDPRTRRALTGWGAALDILDTIDDLEPAHTVRFGVQVDPKEIRGVIPGKEADKTIGYITKYLTKSIAEVLEPPNTRTAEHYDRLHAELQHTPCSPRCPVWLRCGIVPKGASEKTIPGRCRGKAHRRDTLGLPGRRVLVSRRWSGKTQGHEVKEFLVVSRSFSW